MHAQVPKDLGEREWTDPNLMQDIDPGYAKSASAMGSSDSHSRSQSEAIFYNLQRVRHGHHPGGNADPHQFGTEKKLHKLFENPGQQLVGEEDAKGCLEIDEEYKFDTEDSNPLEEKKSSKLIPIASKQSSSK